LELEEEDMFSNDVDDSGNDEFCTVSDDDGGEDDLEGAGHQERILMAKWLADNYADLREWVAHEIRVKALGKPTSYNQKTFFDGCNFPPMSALFQSRI
jgi:hypothetical protein